LECVRRRRSVIRFIRAVKIEEGLDVGAVGKAPFAFHFSRSWLISRFLAETKILPNLK